MPRPQSIWPVPSSMRASQSLSMASQTSGSPGSLAVQMRWPATHSKAPVLQRPARPVLQMPLRRMPSSMRPSQSSSSPSQTSKASGAPAKASQRVPAPLARQIWRPSRAQMPWPTVQMALTWKPSSAVPSQSSSSPLQRSSLGSTGAPRGWQRASPSASQMMRPGWAQRPWPSSQSAPTLRPSSGRPSQSLSMPSQRSGEGGRRWRRR
jgi:hypothetical protein